MKSESERKESNKNKVLENVIFKRVKSFSFTDVSKVSSWRAVEKLIEKIPTSLRGLIANKFAGQRAVFVT